MIQLVTTYYRSRRPPMTNLTHIPMLLSAYPCCTSPLLCSTNISVADKLLLNKLWYQTKTKIKSLKAVFRRSSPIAELPVELVEEILSYLADDIRTLLACSRTCRSWYNVTLPHLHYSLTTCDDAMDPANKITGGPSRSKICTSLAYSHSSNDSGSVYGVIIPGSLPNGWMVATYVTFPHSRTSRNLG